MQNYAEKRFKILMILFSSLLFVAQIYYSVMLFIGASDLNNALISENLKLSYESHPYLLTSRLIVALMGTQSLYINFLSGVMVVFLVLNALNIIDVLYFGLMLVVLYFAITRKNKAVIVASFTSFSRLILFIMLVISGGVAVLQVYLVGNLSVAQVVELGTFVLPITSIIFLLLSIGSYVLTLYLEFRKA